MRHFPRPTRKRFVLLDAEGPQVTRGEHRVGPQRRFLDERDRIRLPQQGVVADLRVFGSGENIVRRGLDRPGEPTPELHDLDVERICEISTPVRFMTPVWVGTCAQPEMRSARPIEANRRVSVGACRKDCESWGDSSLGGPGSIHRGRPRAACRLAGCAKGGIWPRNTTPGAAPPPPFVSNATALTGFESPHACNLRSF